jgi:hypothetical protein
LVLVVSVGRGMITVKMMAGLAVAMLIPKL